MLSDEALQINEKRKEVKGKGERERYTNMQKKGKECNRMGKTRDLFRKIGHNKGQIWHNKGQKWQGPNRSRGD